ALFMRTDSRQSEKRRVARANNRAFVADVDDLADGRQPRKLRDGDRDWAADRRVRVPGGAAVRRRTNLSVAASIHGDERGRGKRAPREELTSIEAVGAGHVRFGSRSSAQASATNAVFQFASSSSC